MCHSARNWLFTLLSELPSTNLLYFLIPNNREYIPGGFDRITRECRAVYETPLGGLVDLPNIFFLVFPSFVIDEGGPVLPLIIQ